MIKWRVFGRILSLTQTATVTSRSNIYGYLSNACFKPHFVHLELTMSCMGLSINDVTLLGGGCQRFSYLTDPIVKKSLTKPPHGIQSSRDSVFVASPNITTDSYLTLLHCPKILSPLLHIPMENSHVKIQSCWRHQIFLKMF